MRIKQVFKKGTAILLLAAVFLCHAVFAGFPVSASQKDVTIRRAEEPYYYSDYGFGSMFTYKYTVTYGNISATAYCVEPSKLPPGSGEYTVKKLSDGKNLAKVCYYGTKASGDDSFFSQDSPYGALSAGARFILVHLAASYANGSSDAFSGANEKGKELAMKLYHYCVSQPDIPDVDMSFSDAELTAYAEGNLQRTRNVTFHADEQQTITLKLPKGVRFHNVKTGKTSAAGAEVTISGGAEFYLSAPLTQAEDVSAAWSAVMKGSVTKDYSAYRVSTGNNQDLAFVFGEGAEDEKYVELQVKWLEHAEISLLKQDASSKKGVAEAVYGVYRDAACTDLVLKMPRTDTDGKTAADIIKTQKTFYIREISVPEGYLLDTAVYPIKVNGSAAVKLAVSDREVRGKITVKKVDAQTGAYEGQGDAVLTGAVYGLYAGKDIVHPDGHSGVVYPAGTLVGEKVFGKADTVTFQDLYLGSYYIKEITAPEGYQKDESTYEADLSYKDSDTQVVVKNLTIKEKVKRQAFQIVKISTDGTNGETDAVSGAEFTVKLEREVKAAGWEKAQVYDVLKTDGAGYAKSKELPYGTYAVRETRTPAGTLTVKDFTVTVREDSREPQSWRIFNDAPYQAYVRLVKRDAVSGRTICLSGASFQILNTETNEHIVQTVGGKKIDTFTTGEDGMVTTPLMLPAGSYAVTEIKAPCGYLLNTSQIPFSVGDTGAVRMQTDEDGNPVLEIVIEDEAVTGTVRIYKHGEQLSGISDAGDRLDFSYTDGSLEGALFQITADEDIYTPDGQCGADKKRSLAVYEGVKLTKGAVAACVRTDENGRAQVSGLPLGRYQLREIETPEGFLSDAQPVTFILSYKDQETAEVSYERDCENIRVKTELSLVKQNSVNKEPVEGAVYGVYNASDIWADGKLLVERDTLLETGVTDQMGKISFSSDLPLGAYYIKEISTAAGYLPDSERHSVHLQQEDAEKGLAKVQIEVAEQPIIAEISKTDITGGKEVPGAYLEVYDESGALVESWKSTDRPHRITAIPAGNYRLHEKCAPRGYVRTSDAAFSVAETGAVQKVSMCNETVRGQVVIQKTDADSKKALEGVRFELRDADNRVLERLKTDKKGLAVSGLYEIASFADGVMGEPKVYKVVETEALDGYQREQKEYQITFAYKDDGTPVVEKQLYLTNRPLPKKASGPKTGDRKILFWWICLGAAAVGGFCIRKKLV